MKKKKNNSLSMEYNTPQTTQIVCKWHLTIESLEPHTCKFQLITYHFTVSDAIMV